MILLLSFDVRRKGGIERLTCQVLTTLKSQGQEVLLLTPRRLGPGIVGRLLGRTRFLLELIWLLPQASRVLSMHVLLLKPVLWLQAIRQKNQTLLCWMHGIEVWGSNIELVREVLQQCDQLIASSHFTRKRVEEALDKSPPINVVHPMADLINSKESPAPFPEKLTLLTVARMDQKERYKGHELVIEALHQMKKEGNLDSRLSWRIIGGGNDRRRLEDLVELLQLGPWVTFLGNVPDQVLTRELRQCSVMLMPSCYALNNRGEACGEGFGIVYLEAAQAGRPSIACRQGGQTDLIIHKKTGWLIESSPKELAQCLINLAENPDIISQAGKCALRRSKDFFSPDIFESSLRKSIEFVPAPKKP